MQEQHFELPDGTMYCKIDKQFVVKDYAPYRFCLRLFGVSPNDFYNERWTSQEGTPVYVLDIDYFDIDYFPTIFHIENQDDLWIEVKYLLSEKISNSYSYQLFSGSDPIYIDIIEFIPFIGPTIPHLTEKSADTSTTELDESSDWVLESFHVGQGMCSVFHNESTGYIFDIGAGTPLKRDKYRKSNYVNDLHPLISKISDGDNILSLIISHPDSDHWRLLDWDEEILKCIGKVYLPSGNPSLAFNSHKIKNKVEAVGIKTLSNKSGTTKIIILRSDPSRSDKNGECLVSICETHGKKALIPGDYVYTRIMSDHNPDIRALQHQHYDAIIVPHHGDKASQSSVFPRASDTAKSFFSAGNNQKYGHPTPSSIAAHEVAGYIVIDKHDLTEIISERLIP